MSNNKQIITTFQKIHNLKRADCEKITLPIGAIVLAEVLNSKPDTQAHTDAWANNWLDQDEDWWGNNWLDND